jgi:hypothetical protein
MRHVIFGLAALPAIAVATVTAVSGLRTGDRPAPADEGRMPDLGGAIGWLNSAPLTRESLKGEKAAFYPYGKTQAQVMAERD